MATTYNKVLVCCKYQLVIVNQLTTLIPTLTLAVTGSNVCSLTDVDANVVAYIAGYMMRKAAKRSGQSVSRCLTAPSAQSRQFSARTSKNQYDKLI